MQSTVNAKRILIKTFLKQFDNDIFFQSHHNKKIYKTSTAELFSREFGWLIIFGYRTLPLRAMVVGCCAIEDRAICVGLCVAVRIAGQASGTVLIFLAKLFKLKQPNILIRLHQLISGSTCPDFSLIESTKKINGLFFSWDKWCHQTVEPDWNITSHCLFCRKSARWVGWNLPRRSPTL